MERGVAPTIYGGILLLPTLSFTSAETEMAIPPPVLASPIKSPAPPPEDLM